MSNLPAQLDAKLGAINETFSVKDLIDAAAQARKEQP